MNPEDGHSLQQISSDTDLTTDQSADKITGQSADRIIGQSADGITAEGVTDGATARTLKSSPVHVSPCHPGYYHIRGEGERGLGVMVCNINFSLPLKMRKAAVADRDNISNLFHRMGLRVETHSDLTGLELKLLIGKYAGRDQSKFDCFFMAVSSHGERDNILGTDGVPVSIEKSVLSPFNGEHCPTLRGKPKVFFLQACRGGDKDFCVTLPDNETDGNGATEQATRLIDRIRHFFGASMASEGRVIPTELDFFVAYSTVPGYVSWRNTEKGSWFLFALCECYYIYSTEVHLSDLMTYVTDYVVKCFSDIDEDTKRIAKQVICSESRLSKFLKVPADRNV